MIIYLCVEVARGIKLSNNTEGNGLRGKFLGDLKSGGQNPSYTEQMTIFEISCLCREIQYH